MTRQPPCVAGQGGEDLLRDIGRKMGIIGAPEGGAVNEVEVAVDQFGERCLGPVLGVSAEQSGIIIHWVHLLNSTDPKTEQ
jgi:hypothetical protein